MPVNTDVPVSRFIPQGSIKKNFLVSEKGYESGIIYIQNYSTIGINLICSKKVTFSIIGLNTDDIQTTPQKSKLFFQKELEANTLYQERFNVTYNYVIVQVFIDQTLPPTDTCEIDINSCFMSRNQYNPAGFINSSISKVRNTNLITNSNDFHLDLVRGIHTDFTKVNILGIHQNRVLAPTNTTVVYPTSEFTLGLHNANFTIGNQFTPPSAAEALRITTNNTNDINNGTVGAVPPYSDATNSGARVLTMIYIDTNGAKQSVDVVSGSGLIGVSATAVLRIFVKEAGSDGSNKGDIAITNDLASRIYALINRLENESQGAIYQVPTDKNLVLRNITINTFFQGGTLKVLEHKNGLSYPLGVFRVGTTGETINYDLDGLVGAGSYIFVNIIPDGTTGGDNVINCNINAFECPLINSF